MKNILKSITKTSSCIAVMLAGVLVICYGAFAERISGFVGRFDAAADSGTFESFTSSESRSDSDPGIAKLRREWLDRFFSLGSISPTAHARALQAVRELPLSPILRGGIFAPTAPAVQGWTQPIPPPILNDQIPNNDGDATTRIQALGLDPTNNKIVYTGSLGGVAKSTDAGNTSPTWRYLSDSWSSQAITCIAVDSNPSYVYVGTGALKDPYPPIFAVGLYRSSDAGATWANVGATEFELTFVRAIAAGSTGTVYVANARSHSQLYPPGLWRSTNSGDSWALKHRAGNAGSAKEWNGIYDVAVDRAIASTVYIADDDGIWKSSNSGDDWIFMQPPLPAGGDTTRLSVVNSVLYALAGSNDNRKLYKYIGNTWVEIASPPGGLAIFAVNPDNTQTIIGGNIHLYRTQNEGGTWTEVAADVHIDHRMLAFSSDHSGIVYDGNDGGIVRSTDHGQTWKNLNHNFAGAWLYGVALSQDGTMIGGTQDSGVLFSDPLAPWGRAWDSVDAGDSFHNLIDPNDASTGYRTIYLNPGLFRFNRLTPRQVTNIRPAQFDADCACNPYNTVSMNLKSPTHIIAACQRVARTLNGPGVTSMTWTQIGPYPLPSPSPCSAGIIVSAVAEAPNNSNVIYAVTQYDTVYVTTDANRGMSAAWQKRTQQNQPGGISTVTVDPTASNVAYLACDSDVYKTTDTGVTWNRCGSPDDAIYRDVAVDPTRPQYIFAAGNAGVLSSTDGGGTWADMTSGIPRGLIVTALSLNPLTLDLAAATMGRGVYLTNIDDAAPTVQITSPQNFATVSGTITVTATASDNLGVIGVQFKLDGSNLGAEDTSAPYSVSWNTTTSTNGTHSLTAEARDRAGNRRPSNRVVVTVSNR